MVESGRPGLAATAAGLSSYTKLTRAASYVVVTDYGDRLELAAWRNHPPGGWMGTAGGPVSEVVDRSPGAVGAKLLAMADAADRISDLDRPSPAAEDAASGD